MAHRPGFGRPLRWGRLLLAACVLWIGLPRPCRGDPQADFERSLRAFHRQAGPQRITHLRELWMGWETADPLSVEQALAAVGADSSLEPAVRVYARLLRAYARRRRGDLVGAAREVRSLGFVTDWLVLGPFDNENQAGFEPMELPERELAQPVMLDRSYQGRGGPVRWRPSPDVNRMGWLDFGALMPPEADICALGTTYVRSGRDTDGNRPLTLWIGATGAVKLYWNDELVLRDSAYRQLDVDRAAVQVLLRPGYNRLTVKGCGSEVPPAVAVRVALPDGAPAANVDLVASVQASTEAATAMRSEGAEPPSEPDPGAPSVGPAPPSEGEASRSEAIVGSEPLSAHLWIHPSAEPARVAGPLQQFAHQLSMRPDDVALMEDFARYLMVSGGDPASSHLARDLAGRAAEREPSVARCLLAARLAEDRNQRRRWVAAARDRAVSDTEMVDVLLAEARLARTGTHWQDAVPLYDEVLSRDPRATEAILGKVDLFVEAGLKRTALATLERAVEGQPSSVALLRALSAQLRALGRDSEAAEVEARYAALRFDDAGFLRHQLERAVARGETATVERWSARLLAVEPGSSWAHGVVARARRAVGDAAGAERTYRRALEIAPDEVTTLRALADLQGEKGRRAEQIALLERISRIRPQDRAIRAYLEHIAPQRARQDEQHAWSAQRFLALRSRAEGRHDRRTLRKLTVLTLLPNGLARRFHQVVYQPLTDEAAASLRQYAFAYHADRQTVEVRSAKVYRGDGSVDEAIERGTASADNPALRMYTLQRAYYVQFPRLEPGDVVELQYRVDDLAGLGDPTDAFGEIEILQGSDPVLDAEVVVVAPESLELRAAASAGSGLAREERVDGGQRVVRFHASDLSAIRAEPHMPPWPELAAHVHVSTAANWDSLGRWYWELVRDQLDVDDAVRRKARQLTAGLSDVRSKVAAIYRFAADEIRYVALEFGIEGIRPRRAALTLARGWGDCKDKATLIVSLLREVGVDAELVLVRSGLRGRLSTTVASLAPFDHAIAWIPALGLYLDGTATATGMGELPAMIRGAMALRVSSDGAELVQLPDPPADESVERRQFAVRVSPGGRLDLRGELESRGVTAPAWRARYQAESTRRERVLRDLADAVGTVELAAGPRGLKVLHGDQPELPIRLEVRGKRTAQLEAGTLRLSVGPTYGLTRRYASLPKRHYPVVIGPRRTSVEAWTVEIGANQSLRSLPAPLKLDSPFGSYHREVKQAASEVTVRSTLVLRRSRVEPQDYPAWRRFAQAVDAASGPSLVVALRR